MVVGSGGDVELDVVGATSVEQATAITETTSATVVSLIDQTTPGSHSGFPSQSTALGIHELALTGCEVDRNPLSQLWRYEGIVSVPAPTG